MALKITSYYSNSSLPELPGTDIFHSATLFHIYEHTSDYKPVMVVATDGDKVVGKLLAVVQRVRMALGLFSLRRCEVFGTGEYFGVSHEDEESIFKTMLEAVTRYAERMGCDIVEFRNLGQAMKGYAAFRGRGFFAVNWMSVINDLTEGGSVEEMMDKSRLRQVRSGLRHWATVSEPKDMDEVMELATMLKRNYRTKVRRHFPDLSFFMELGRLATNGSGIVKMYIVRHEGKVIGGSVCLWHGSRVSVRFSGGMRKTHRRQYPGVVSVWKALADAKAHGMESVEFMDVGLPFRRHGYRNFVLRFGGEQMNTLRWFRVRWRWVNAVLRWLYS